MSRYRISIYSIFSYALFFAVFKPYFLPDIIRQVLKILILVGTCLFLIFNTNRKILLNFSLVFCSCVTLSGIVAFICRNYGFRDILESLLYALTFYVMYTFSALCESKGYSDKLITCMYRMNLIYCILTVISVAIVGVENNSNNVAYLFGNKFTSAYLFILFIALYGASHDMSKKRNEMTLCMVFIFSIFFCLHMGCATATVTLVFLFALYLLPNKLKQQVIKEKYVVIVLILSALIVLWIEAILKIDFINKVVTDYFEKSYTITGRLEIYGRYLPNIILGSFWVGHGYSNTIMIDLTGLYTNSQNGLLDIFVNFGLLGVAALLFTVYHCFKRSEKGTRTFYLSLVVYGMIIAAIFEVSLNWFFLLGLCLIRWNCKADKFVVRRR